MISYYKNIYKVSNIEHTLNLSTIESIESKIGAKFPTGYSEFLQEFGPGQICGWFWLFDPTEIKKNNIEYRDGLSAKFWDNGEVLLHKDDYSTLNVLAADSFGNTIAFLPKKNSSYYIFPRHNLNLFKIDTCFKDLLQWSMSSNVLCEMISPIYFESWKDRSNYDFSTYQNSPPIIPVKKVLEENWDADFFDVVQEEDTLYYFIKEYGACIEYFRNYKRLKIRFDKKHQDTFLPKLKIVLKNIFNIINIK